MNALQLLAGRARRLAPLQPDERPFSLLAFQDAPTQIHLSLTEKPAEEMVVMWRTAGSAAGAVQYGETPLFGTVIPATHVASGGGYIHTAILAGLSGGTTADCATQGLWPGETAFVELGACLTNGDRFLVEVLADL